LENIIKIAKLFEYFGVQIESFTAIQWSISNPGGGFLMVKANTGTTVSFNEKTSHFHTFCHLHTFLIQGLVKW